MSAENVKRKSTADPSGTQSKNKKSILYEKTFLIDIIDKISSSKVEKLINAYGGKVIQSLEKNIDYLISDNVNNERLLHKGGSDTSNPRKEIEAKNVPYSKRKNSNDLINKATLLSIQILSPKKFQQWLKSLIRQHRIKKKKPTDQVASVLRGKVSLKIESMDQGQCPVFEFIPKWPDLGDTLYKKKTKIPAQHKFSGDNSNEYSSDQYSTSEIGGMCELCDMPFMNYKEHINTKKHMRESQDEIRFHELDELINERPLNVIFNQFVPDKKISEDQELPAESSSVKNCIENSVITIVDSDAEDKRSKTMHYSFRDENPSIFKEQELIRLERCLTDTNISFVPQKRPSNTQLYEKCKRDKKIKRKYKTCQKLTSKDIYKVEVVNNRPSNSKSELHNSRVTSDKPPVIIRLKRVKRLKNKYLLSDIDDYGSISSDDCDKKISEKGSIPANKFIRVVRKPSFNSETRHSSSKGYSKNQIFTFENPELRQNFPNNISYYPTYTCLPNTMSSVEYIQEKISKLGNYNFKRTMPFNESLKMLSNAEPQKIGEWFYNVQNKIQDDLSFDSTVLVPFS